MSIKVSQTTNPEFEAALLHPRYWPTWALMALWWLLTQLPYPLLVWMGRGIGQLFYRFATVRRLITMRNLELCFPEWTESQRTAVMRESFESAGISFFEMGMAWWWSNDRLKKLCRVKGLEHVANLNGQGAMLLGMHFTTLDLAGTGLSLFQSYGSMYRAHENRVFNYVQFRGRSRQRHSDQGELVIFPRGDLRTMIRLLRNGKLVWYAPDQDYGKDQAVFAPFFGVPAATLTATAKLAQMGKARVLPFTHTRLPGYQGYEIIIHAPLENFPMGADIADATCINQVVERHIRACPGQYLWAHRRFKSRPPGVENRYPEIYPSRVARRLKRIEREQKAVEQQGDQEALAQLQKKKVQWERVQQEISRQDTK